MSGSQIVLQPAEFNELFDHLSTYMDAKYENMHLRKSKQVPIIDGKCKTEAVLKHIQIVHKKDQNTLEGAISGAGIDIVYLIERGSINKVKFTRYKIDDPKEEARILSKFVLNLMDRVRKEQDPDRNLFVNYKPGRYYVRRHLPGIKFADPICQQALASGAFSKAFLEKLEKWNFQLLFPGN
jgi:hypothetical protein